MTVAVTNPSTSSNAQIASGQQSLNTDYNSFLKLLTTQLQNQDPLSPMDTNTFTQQLVAMNGVQQQLLGNNLLQTLVNQSGGPASAVGLIGQTIQAQATTATMADGGVKWTYDLGGQAAAAQMQVLDSAGKVIYTAKAPDLTKGQHVFSWDGTTTSGGKATAGDYTLKITANDASLKGMSPGIFIEGVVTGVTNSNGVAELNLGSTMVPYNSLTTVKPTKTSTSTN